jgi:hypothetical protein
MEPEGSLPHSQVPATCPYPEPARSILLNLWTHHAVGTGIRLSHGSCTYIIHKYTEHNVEFLAVEPGGTYSNHWP